jgi:hypothetical protein
MAFDIQLRDGGAGTFDISLSGDASTVGYIKVWSGAAWVKYPVKYWNGSSWIQKPLKYWNGSAWITTT